MSTAATAATCEIPISLSDLMPLILVQGLTGKSNINLDAVLQAMVYGELVQGVVNKLMSQVPAEYKDIVCTMLELDQLKLLTSVLSGKINPDEIENTIFAVIRMIVMLSVISRLKI